MISSLAVLPCLSLIKSSLFSSSFNWQKTNCNQWRSQDLDWERAQNFFLQFSIFMKNFEIFLSRDSNVLPPFLGQESFGSMGYGRRTFPIFLKKIDHLLLPFFCTRAIFHDLKERPQSR